MRRLLASLTATAGLAAASLGLFSASPAEAAVFNPTCSVASLRANLIAAAAVPGPHVVVLPANCVYSFTNTAPTNPDSALPAITRNVVILGNGSVFLRAPGAPNMRFLEVRNGGALAVRNLTLSGGANPPSDGLVASPAYAGELNGGAIRCTDAGLILDAVGMDGNVAENGGSVYAEDCDVAIVNSYVTKSEATLGDGGGVLVTHVDDADVVFAADRSHFWDNQAATNGGAIFADINRFAIDESDVLRNTAGANGGGIHVTTANVPSQGVTFSTIADNMAGADGGGLYMTPGTNGSISVNFSTVSHNTAANGGGLVMAYGGIIRTTISGNTATNAAGGLLTNWATVALNRATLADNTSVAGLGNAIGGWGTIYPINSLAGFSGVAPAGTLCDTTAGLSLYSGVPAPVANLSEGACLGFTAIAAGAAALQPLAANGGPTLTHALGVGSAALDTGDQPSCDATLGMGNFDQRGAPFVLTFGARCDVGALEAQ